MYDYILLDNFTRLSSRARPSKLVPGWTVVYGSPWLIYVLMRLYLIDVVYL